MVLVCVMTGDFNCWLVLTVSVATSAERADNWDWKLPCVIQYNKRDLLNALPIEELQATLNPGWVVEEPARQKPVPDPVHAGEYLVFEQDGQWIERAPWFAATAISGEGVFDTLRAISKRVVQALG